MNENLVLIRNFLFKWFVIGFALFILNVTLYIIFKDFGAEMCMELYNVNLQDYYNISLGLFGFFKLFLLFCVLSPAIALHWLIKSNKKSKNL